MMTQETIVDQTAEMDEAAIDVESITDAASGGDQANGDSPDRAVAEAIVGEIVADATEDGVDGDTDEGQIAGEDEVGSEPTDAEIIDGLRAQLVETEQKSAELVDKLQRTAAEFQNSRRRQEKQLSDAIERAGTHTVQRLLPVIDDLTLAFNNLPEDIDETTNAWVDGFRQIGKKLESLLEDQDVTAMPLEGEFDPNRHEAVSNEPSETTESGHIIETLRIGYEHKGRVLRPALVRVAM